MRNVLKKVCQKITIYHKKGNEFQRYVVDASVRSTAYRNRNNAGIENYDNVLIRIFDVDGYKNSTFLIAQGDVIFNGESTYEIIKAPITELRNLYGKERVYEVSSVEEFIFDEIKIKKLNHIKIGAR